MLQKWTSGISHNKMKCGVSSLFPEKNHLPRKIDKGSIVLGRGPRVCGCDLGAHND